MGNRYNELSHILKEREGIVREEYKELLLEDIAKSLAIIADKISRGTNETRKDY